MKKRLLTLNRILIIAAALIVQIVWLCVLFTRLVEYSVLINDLLVIISICVLLFIVKNDNNSDAKLSWIILIMAVPIFGGILYILLGGGKNKSDALCRKLSHGEKLFRGTLSQDPSVLADFDNSGEVKYLLNQGFPVWRNTDIKYFALGDDAFIEMLKDLENATESIYIEYFIIAPGLMWDSMLEIIKRKASEGVDVRVIYDDIGCFGLLSPDYPKELSKYGIKCVSFNPFRPFLSIIMNNRDHRKILAIDGKVAYTGGINLADEYINRKEKYGHWKDNAIRFEGDAVLSFQVMFLQMWNSVYKTRDDLSALTLRTIPSDASDGFVQPYCDTPLDNEKVGENVYLNLINNAKDALDIFTPYLILSNTMESALILAAKRGVRVRIITPGIPDKKLVFAATRSYYRRLIEGGVEIYEYTPGFIHSKTFICDQTAASVGTINADFRSLLLHFECGAVIYNAKIIKDIKLDFDNTVKSCRKIDEKDCKAGPLKGLLESLLRVIAPLL